MSDPADPRSTSDPSDESARFAPWRPGDEGRFGDYEVLARLESGGMGEVFLARKLGAGGFEKLVALKTIRGELRGAEPLRKMFLDEARLLARLSHPVIAQVHDFGEDRERLFLAMEYVDGIHFRALANRRPPPAIAARAIAQVCRGLHAAHQQRDLSGRPLEIVHRDVTPENLMLTFSGQVKILDFGIALMRGRQAPVTELGTIKGKPPYLSPEQLKNQPVDRRTDIFSVGIVLHELLTGEPLFVGDSVYAVARAIEHAEIEPPSATAGPLPAGLDQAVLHALERDPDRRYDSALELAETLDRIATAAGGESLEQYALRELDQPRERHRRDLAALLQRKGSPLVGPAGRASGVLTAQSALDPALLGDDASRAPEPPPPSAPDLSTRDLVAAVRGHGRGRRLALAVAAVAVAVAGIALWLWWPRAHSANDTAARLPDAAPTAPAPVVGATVPDAAPIATAPTVPPPADHAEPAHPPARSPRRVPADHRTPAPVEPATPTPQPVATPEVATGQGFLTVAAEPFALVRIDGKEIGTTPIFRRALAAGDHQVILVGPDSGEVRLRRTVHIRDGKLEEIVLR